MDTSKANGVENETETKIDGAQGINENIEPGPFGNEQNKIIEKLEEVLNFFKSVQIKDDIEESLVFINKPLDDLHSSLKYIPIEKYFTSLPSELKMNILSYLCDSNAFTAASVCQEWKKILKSRFAEKTVTLGRPCCSSRYSDNECKKCTKDNRCLLPEVMLQASSDHKMEVKLEIFDHVKEVDSKLLSDGLTSAKNFRLSGDCTCYHDRYDSDSDDSDFRFRRYDSDNECEINPLSFDQLDDLFKSVEIKEEIMESVELKVDLSALNQDRLAHCLVDKTKCLLLLGSQHGRLLNFETFIRKLSEQSTELKLNHLTLSSEFLEFPAELALEVADALCNVEYVEVHFNVPLKFQTMEKLFQNVIERDEKIKTLINWKPFDCRKIIDPENLKKFLNKMIKLRLHADFTQEQIEAANSLPDVIVNLRPGSFTIIGKGLR